MPVLHFVDASNRLVITTCAGEVSREEVVESLKELRAHPDFRPDFGQLADLSEVSRLNLSFNDMEAIARLYNPFSNEGKRAMVVPVKGATFGLTRMYQLLVDHEHFEIFQSAHDAIVWLGLGTTILEAASKINRAHAGKVW